MNAVTKATIAIPGTNICIGFVVNTCLASFSIAPHSGIGACTPKPKKDNQEKFIIAQPISKVASTAKSAVIDGNK